MYLCNIKLIYEVAKLAQGFFVNIKFQHEKIKKISSPSVTQATSTYKDNNTRLSKL